ncbi:MAG: glycosyltransferase family A protein [Bacteroidota bacterium]
MSVFKNPDWTNRKLYRKTSLEQIDADTLDQLAQRLKKFRHETSSDVCTSICIAAWNEELNIIKCLDSLSRNIVDCKVEIIVVNNNSSDRTQQVLDRLGVQSYFQPIQGCGVSRQLAQVKAKGKYILSADADCLYPKKWVSTMTSALKRKNTVAVYSKHSFLGDREVPRWKYYLYELGKFLITELRDFRRPYLNAYGMSMGYIKELGLKEGYVTRNIRGEDGRLCFDLMKYGNVQLVRSSNARTWTSDRNLEKDGSLSESIYKRILREILRVSNYFTKPEWHDTKTSENTEMSKEDYKKSIKQRFTFKK